MPSDTKGAFLPLAILVACGLVFVLSGCTTPTVVSPATDWQKLDEARRKEIASLNTAILAQRDVLQSVSGDVYGVQNASAHLPPGNPTEAVRAQADLAAGKLPEPTPEQRLEKERQNTLFLSGQLERARSEIEVAKSESRKLKSQIEEAQRTSSALAKDNELLRRQTEIANAKHEENVRRLVSDAQRKADEAKQEAYSERNRLIFFGLLGLSGLAFLGGVALLVATQGREFIRAGIAFAIGSGFVATAKTISHPYFLPIFWSVVGLSVIGVAVYAWHERKTAKAGEENALAKVALAKTAEGIDAFKQALSAEQREKLKSELRQAQDEIHVNLIDKLRGKSRP